MKLDGLMFDTFYFYQFTVRVGFMRYNASIRSYIFNDAIMNELVKGKVFEFIGLGRTKNWIILFESKQY